MKNLIIVARVTGEPNVRNTEKTTIATFSLAHSAYRNGGKTTEYFEVRAWGKLAEWVKTYVKKGKRYAISSSDFGFDNYLNKEGNKIQKFIITADNIEFADGKETDEIEVGGIEVGGIETGEIEIGG